MKIDKLLKKVGIKKGDDAWENTVNPEFKEKFEAFEELKKTSTPEEVAQADEELVNLFNELHNIDEDDEVKNLRKENEEKDKAKQKAEEGKAKAEQEKAESEAKAKALQEKEEARENSRKEKELYSTLIKSIREAKTTEELDSIPLNGVIKDEKLVEKLQTAINKKLEAINEKITAAKQKEEEEQQAQQHSAQVQKNIDFLKAKGIVTYDDLRSIGIEPTGVDMEYHGLKLIKTFMFLKYEVL